MSICSSISPSQCVQHCQQLRPLTKAAILVIGLLFAGGAVVAHLQMLPLGCTIGFSVASAGLLAVFVAGCVGRVCLSKESSADLMISGLKAEIDRMAFNQLIEALTPMNQQEVEAWLSQKSHPLGEGLTRCKTVAANCAGKSQADLTSIFSQHLVLEALFKKFHSAFKDKAEITQLLAGFKSFPRDKMETILALAVSAGIERQGPYFTASLLEEILEEDQIDLLVFCLWNALWKNDKYIQSEIVTVEFEGVNQKGTSVHVKEITIHIDNLFNGRDYHVPITPTLAQAILEAVHKFAKEVNHEVKQPGWRADSRKPMGIGIKIAPNVYYQFPASKIAPLLEGFRAIPGLIKLHLEAGQHYDAPENRFTMEDCVHLHLMIVANPTLVHLALFECFNKSTDEESATMTVFEKHWDTYKSVPLLARILISNYSK